MNQAATTPFVVPPVGGEMVIPLLSGIGSRGGLPCVIGIVPTWFATAAAPGVVQSLIVPTAWPAPVGAVMTANPSNVPGDALIVVGTVMFLTDFAPAGMMFASAICKGPCGMD